MPEHLVFGAEYVCMCHKFWSFYLTEYTCPHNALCYYNLPVCRYCGGDLGGVSGICISVSSIGSLHYLLYLLQDPGS